MKNSHTNGIKTTVKKRRIIKKFMQMNAIAKGESGGLDSLKL
jgi:hypothetical protein